MSSVIIYTYARLKWEQLRNDTYWTFYLINKPRICLYDERNRDFLWEVLTYGIFTRVNLFSRNERANAMSEWVLWKQINKCENTIQIKALPITKLFACLLHRRRYFSYYTTRYFIYFWPLQRELQLKTFMTNKPTNKFINFIQQ